MSSLNVYVYLILASSIFVTILLHLLLLLLLTPTHNQNQTYSHHLPPGPPPLPFVGNLLHIDGSVPHISFRRLSSKYGHLMLLKLGRHVNTIVVSSSKLAEQVLRTHDLVLCTRPPRVGQRKLSYDGLNLAFSPFDSYSRNMKKLCIVHLFTPKRVESFVHVRAQEVSKLMDRITLSSEPFNLSGAMITLAGSLVCRMAFGRKYEQEEEEGSDKGSRFQWLISETQCMFTRFFFSDHFPCLGFVDRLTGSIGRLETTFEGLDGFCQEIVDEHLDPERVRSGFEQEDVVDILLRIMKDESICNNKLTVDHVKAITMDLFIAGTDTVAAALVWGMTYLMKNPSSMGKAQLEVRQAVGRINGKKPFVTEQHIKQLPYLKSVIKETLRLQPPAPLLIRESSQDFELDGYEIPSKTVVYVNAWAIGRDPETWGDDSEEFKPERFMDDSYSNKYMGSLEFGLIPFGGGRRKCPGMNMGIATVELALANLLYGFDWEMPEGMEREDLDMDVVLGLTMHKKNDLCLVATPYMHQ